MELCHLRDEGKTDAQESEFTKCCKQYFRRIEAKLLGMREDGLPRFHAVSRRETAEAC